MASLGIVTVLYQSEGVVEDFIRSLSDQTFRDFRLYLVDNASPDGSAETAWNAAEKAGISFRMIRNGENTGVAAGNNRGIACALADGCGYILLSNNDIVVGKDTVMELWRGLQESGAGMAVPRIYFHGSRRIWSARGRFRRISGSTEHYGYGEKDTPRTQVRRFVDYAPTCFTLIRKEVFGKIGTMDEKYFVYYDDTDFMWRAKKAGIRTLYLPSGIVFHKVGGSTGGSDSPAGSYYMDRNVIYFSRKNHSFFQTAVVCAYHSARVLGKILSGRFAAAKALSRAIGDGMRMSRH